MSIIGGGGGCWMVAAQNGKNGGIFGPYDTILKEYDIQ